jgi:hypothetical protein
MRLSTQLAHQPKRVGQDDPKSSLATYFIQYGHS